MMLYHDATTLILGSPREICVNYSAIAYPRTLRERCVKYDVITVIVGALRELYVS